MSGVWVFNIEPVHPPFLFFEDVPMGSSATGWIKPNISFFVYILTMNLVENMYIIYIYISYILVFFFFGVYFVLFLFFLLSLSSVENIEMSPMKLGEFLRRGKGGGIAPLAFWALDSGPALGGATYEVIAI